MKCNFQKTVLVMTLFSLALVGACKEGGKEGSAKAGTNFVNPLPDSTVIVEYNGGKITAADVKPMIQSEIKRVNEEMIEAYKKTAENQVITKLVNAEAKKQGLNSAEELISKIVSSNDVSDEQVNKFIKDNDLEKGFKDPRTGERKKVSKEDIKRFLGQQKEQQFLQNLMATANIKVLLEEPRVDNLSVDPNAPFLGSKNAKVVIQEFSDFQCPYCAKAHPLVGQITQAYGDKVLFVFRQFPLPPRMHPEAKPAAIASLCAHRQGKFWPMHDMLFKNSSNLSSENYIKWGKEIGLDMSKFEPCVKKAETAKDVEKEQSVGESVGVDSTPTFFINNKKIKGASQFEQFKSIIDQELSKN